MKPSDIVRQLNQHVIGQEEAKRILAVAVYSHLKRTRPDSAVSNLVKSNILLIGPTGSGKTLLCETLSNILDVPFVTADATALAQSEYVGEDIEAILHRLLDRSGGDLERAQRGIIFIDEVDKLKATGQSRGPSAERVQHALLKIMEGSSVRLKNDLYMDTTQVLFICGGAFVGLRDIMVKNNSFGFISTSESDSQKILDRLNARVKPTDLNEFGLIPEFAGRLPVVARLDELDRDMLVRIMVEPKNAIYRQFQSILADEGVELQVEPLVFSQIADLAIEYKAGARSLRGIFEEMVTPVLYLVPDNPAVKKVVITSLFEEPRYFGAPTVQPNAGK